MIFSIISTDYFTVDNYNGFCSSPPPWHKNLYQQVICQAKQHNKNRIDTVPDRLCKLWLMYQPNNQIMDWSGFDKSFLDYLMDFQKQAIEKGVLMHGRVLLADEMGLGKTLVALGIAMYFIREWPLLIICPSSLINNWIKVVQKWVPSAKVGRKVGDCNVLVQSYESAVKNKAKICFSVIICDESHYLKNSRTARTITLTPVLKRAERRILCSGTPATSRPIELFSQLDILKPNLMKYVDFGVRYCGGFKEFNRWNFQGCSNSVELCWLLDTLMIRRCKKDVLRHLVPKTRVPIFLEANEIKPESSLNMWHETSLRKVNSISNFMSKWLDENSAEKCLIFAHHTHILDSLEVLVTSKKISFIRIDGTTPNSLRSSLCDQFQVNDSIRVALLSLMAAGVGLSFTSAHQSFFTELYWNPGVVLQAEDRVHRLGQTRPVCIYYMLAKGTVDDTMWPLLLRKLDVLESVNLSENELADIGKENIIEINENFVAKGLNQDDQDDDEFLLCCLDYVEKNY